jgi:hypothetical protein
MAASMCISPTFTNQSFGQFSSIAIGFFPLVLSGGCFDPLHGATGGHGSDLAAVCLVFALGKAPLLLTFFAFILLYAGSSATGGLS